ncbi:hypothetical protein HMPREF0591_6390 [Mycobacterium parascrofulaceum ATCC BAA-614]|uniref:Tyr recombinase domain-containing protein n=1 Tax=Mycobacterium parascrofulaceum ATCC BAA-614 TaxID=525368 RepID=D5PJP6_9MYCO|nr:hypothetical protein HMPREF0591_6390 [Mycobacterium parascrofulaceum ATCC BAA-614]
MAETGIRAGELYDLTVTDVDLVRSVVVVRRGKGGKGRVAPISANCARAIDRYLRARRTHRLADSPALWLGDRGKNLAYFGLRNALSAPHRTGRHRGLPPASHAAHRGVAVAGRRRLRGWVNGCCRVVHPRHDRPLHPRHRRRPRRGGSPQPESRGAVAATQPNSPRHTKLASIRWLSSSPPSSAAPSTKAPRRDPSAAATARERGAGEAATDRGLGSWSGLSPGGHPRPTHRSCAARSRQVTASSGWWPSLVGRAAQFVDLTGRNDRFVNDAC